MEAIRLRNEPLFQPDVFHNPVRVATDDANYYIRIRRVPYEEPHQVNLVLEVSNGRLTTTFGYFTATHDLEELAAALDAFPQWNGHVHLYEIGSERPEDKWASISAYASS